MWSDALPGSGFGSSILEERERARLGRPSSEPLEARRDAALTEEQLRALWVIADYDLSPVRDRLVRSGLMTPGWVDEAVFEFRRYLGLRAVFHDPIPMLSPDVDEVWHACILHTRLYADLCQEVFGRFLHHAPEHLDGVDLDEAWTLFEETYGKLYGALGPLWRFVRRFGSAQEDVEV